MKLLIVGFVCFFSFCAPIWSQGRYERVELLWEDHFDGENPHFISSESDDLIGVVANGSYMLSHKTHKYYHTKYHQVNINPGQDFLIRSKIRFTEGEDDAYYGLVWGYKDVDNHFDFVISKDGFFRILKEKNGVQLIPRIGPGPMQFDQMDNGMKLKSEKQDLNTSLQLMMNKCM